jgi:hypothetical protein
MVDRLRTLLSEGDPHEFSASDLAGFGINPTWYRLSPEERRRRREYRPPFWGHPVRNTLDLATAMVPSLLYERLGDLGFDFAISYPSLGLLFPHLEDEDLRRSACRALNLYNAEQWRPYRDRVTPAAVIPMHTPDEALDELDFAIARLGLKVLMIAGFVERPLPSMVETDPASADLARWVDGFGVDSAYDYDVFWSKCVELGVAPTQHSSASMARSWTVHRTPSNFMFNQIGLFSDANHHLCKSLFLGGVTHRFPQLSFAFLEGGVGWACSLHDDIISRWKKRNRHAIHQYDPATVDRARLAAIITESAPEEVAARGVDAYLDQMWPAPETEATLDDFGALPVETADEVSELFAHRFYFGCEADDLMVPVALRGRRAQGAILRPTLSSDISHWDVPDMEGVLPEAYELVERGEVDEEDFRDFAFVNAVRLHTSANPDFFRGTAIESEVAVLLGTADGRAPAAARGCAILSRRRPAAGSPAAT